MESIGVNRQRFGRGHIKKSDFNRAVLDMKKDPGSTSAQENYIKIVESLCLKLVQWYSIPDWEQEDALQEMLMQVWRKKLYERASLDGDILSLYWTTIQREIWRYAERNDRLKRGGTGGRKQPRKKIVPMNALYEDSYISNQILTDNGEGEEQMLKELGFRLEDYSIEDSLDLVELPSIETSKPKRGRPSRRQPGARADHWENCFKSLRVAKQLHESELVNELSVDNPSLKNATLQKNLRVNLKAIARREGIKLTIVEGSDPIFIVTE